MVSLTNLSKIYIMRTLTKIKGMKKADNFRYIMQNSLNLLINSKRFALKPNAMQLHSDIYENQQLISFYISQLHLPFSKTIIDYGDNSGVFLEQIDDASFKATPFKIIQTPYGPDFGLSLFSIIIDKSKNLWDNDNLTRNLSKAYDDNIVDDIEDIKICAFLRDPSKWIDTNENIESAIDIMNHVSFIKSEMGKEDNNNICSKLFDLLNKSSLTDKESQELFDEENVEILKDWFQEAIRIISGLILMQLKIDFRQQWTHSKTITKGKSGFTITEIDVDINAITYLPNNKYIRKSTQGIRRHHEVKQTWCISRITGNIKCAEICQPYMLSDRRLKCLKCNKKSWLRKSHERGNIKIGSTAASYNII